VDDVEVDFKPMGKTALERSEQRHQVDGLSRSIIPFIHRFLKADLDSPQADKAKIQMLAGLRFFVAAMSSRGPFVAGDTLTVVDIAGTLRSAH
jgi:glutathione S-transferase